MTDYSAAAARRIIRISQRRLDYWDEEKIVSPSAKRASGKGSERRYTYNDLVKLSVVKKLREAGLSLQRIRKGLAKLKSASMDRDPLLTEVLVTDGKSLHRLTPNPAAVEDLLANGQLMFSVVAVGRIDDEVRKNVVKFERRVASRRRPLEKLRRKAR